MPKPKASTSAPTASAARHAIVTGGTSGIGRAAAAGLAQAGLDVTLLVRDRQRGEAAAEAIRAKVPQARIHLLEGDLASQASVRKAAASWLKTHKELHVLVNAAGVFLPDKEMTDEGIERTLATNYLGGALLTELLLPALKRGAPSRVVTVASKYGKTKVDFDDLQFARRRFSYLKAVPQSKLAQVLWTQELAARVQGAGIAVNAVHPGLVANTRLLDQTGGFFRWLTNRLGKTPEVGADTVVWLATAPEAAGETGGLWEKRRRVPTPGQGSDPAARARLWQETESLLAPAR